MILVDTSAWIEYLRATGSPVCERVDRLLSGSLATCDPVRMEIFAGARDDAHLADLRRLLARASEIGVGPADYDRAAAIYRTCRRRGATVRSLVDCLIASLALREDLELLHADADYEVIARCSPLRLSEPA